MLKLIYIQHLKKKDPNIGGVYLQPISDYKKIPELESMEYIYIYIYVWNQVVIVRVRNYKAKTQLATPILV